MLKLKSNADVESQLIVDGIRNDMYTYSMAIHNKFIHAKFTEAVSYEIQMVMEGKNDRLILIAPPRMGKSWTTSETAPAWFLGKWPTKKIICASHTEELATDFGAKVKQNMMHPMHVMAFGEQGTVSKTKSAASNFRTNAGGEYLALGVGGTPIGKGADVYVIDDPIRNRADVESPTKREFYKSWYSSSVLSRLEGQGGIILMHQRWHEDDLAGWLLREEPEEWRVVMFPALIETHEDKALDYLDREIGESLMPALHTREKLERLKKSMITRDWNSMYQGQPRAQEGNEFTDGMLQYYDVNPDAMRFGMNVYIIVDPATSLDKRADYTAMAVVGLAADGNYYLLDLIRERLDLKGRTDKLIALHRQWRPLAVHYESYGAQSDIQHIQYAQGEQNYRFPIHKVGGSTNLRKIEAIQRLIPDMQAGRWFVPSDLVHINADGMAYRPVSDMLNDEMLPFPDAKNDDALDCLSRIYDVPVVWPASNPRGRQQTGKKISPW
jgi:phage terminase large subunit-like protein